MDLDVQGAEYAVLSSCRDLLKQKVKRIHIGTHGPDLEIDLRRMFLEDGWTKLHDFPFETENVPTLYGPMHFYDGVQTWINPNFD